MALRERARNESETRQKRASRAETSQKRDRNEAQRIRSERLESWGSGMASLLEERLEAVHRGVSTFGGSRTSQTFFH